MPGFSTKEHTNLFPDGVVLDVGLPVVVGRGREIREDDEVLGSVGGWEI
jgi:hypothetical protein